MNKTYICDLFELAHELPMNITAGPAALTAVKAAAIRLILFPMNVSAKSFRAHFRIGSPSSPAMHSLNKVLPVPGGYEI